MWFPTLFQTEFVLFPFRVRGFIACHMFATKDEHLYTYYQKANSGEIIQVMESGIFWIDL